MTRVEIEDKLNEFLVDEFEVDASTIHAEANLKETLDLDSLDYVDLVVVIESHFGFKVTGEDFAKIQTFHDFYQYVEDRVEKK